MKTWEICPKCEGSGYMNAVHTTGTQQQCDVCNGHKIINSFTGHPPKGEKTNTNIKP